MTRRKVDGALTVLAVGFSFSLAANLLWTWPGGPVRILGGALASVALPCALHLFPRVRVTDGWHWLWLRGLIVAAIAGLAAYTTYSHASQLLIARGEDVLLASFYPLMTELLVVMGVLARRSPSRAAKAARGPAPSQLQPAPRLAAPQASKRETARQWARNNWRDNLRPVHIRQGLLAEHSITIDKTTASRAHKTVADEHAA